MGSMEKLKNEITKILVNELIHNENRVFIEELDTYFLVTVYENEKEATLKEIKISFPKNIKLLPLIIDNKEYYKLLKESKNCECAILVKEENGKYHLVLVEMKSTLHNRDLKNIISKTKYSSYLSTILLKTFDIAPDEYHVVVAYLKNKIPSTASPTDLDSNINSKFRHHIKKWNQPKWKFEWLNNSHLIVNKKDIKYKNTINWYDIL
jgi:hypothetical protein